MHTLEASLGYTFHNRALLRAALYHSSYANEHRLCGISSNERLEFLGDAVLGLVTADDLFAKYPNLPEGDLTRIRAALVCEESLHEVAQSLHLGDYLQLGKGEEAGGGRRRPSILADAMESVIAASFIDGGMEAALQIVRTFIFVEVPVTKLHNADYKTQLQEMVQQKKNQTLSYELVGQSGPDHDKKFDVKVMLNGTVVGFGSGSSKKRAEQDAARAAIEKLFPEK